MFWEAMTEPQFAQAVKDTGGVCVLPVGAVERHGPHLPLGTDMYVVRHIAGLAAEIEQAIVYPYLPFGQIAEASCYPGTIVTKGDILLELLDAVCKEIARNGMKKIIILNGHGGNPQMLRALAMFQLHSPRDYALYICDITTIAESDPVYIDKVNAFFSNHTWGYHSGNTETSMMMHIHPELVDFASSANDSAEPMNRLPFLEENHLFSPMFWYADYPYHYAGSPAQSSREAGEWITDYVVQKVAQAIKAVREDTDVAKLMAEFYSKREH